MCLALGADFASTHFLARPVGPLTMNQRWVKQTKGTYDFDVTKADKLFEFLVKESRIKLPEGH
jgi:hypothetical protein